MKITSQNGICQIEIPNTYEYSENEVSLDIYHDNGVGAISISSYIIPPNYDFLITEELLDFLQSIDDPVSIENHQIISNDNYYCCTEFTNSIGKYWRIWVYYKDHYAAFATYNCDEKSKDIEKDEVDKIIKSLKLGVT